MDHFKENVYYVGFYLDGSVLKIPHHYRYLQLFWF